MVQLKSKPGFNNKVASALWLLCHTGWNLRNQTLCMWG